MTDEEFEEFYGTNGRFLHRQNIGMLTGHASNGVFIVDVDLQKGEMPRLWYEALVQANGGEFITPTQRTGGGGLQLLFRAPHNQIPSTNKFSDISVDIRGVGGFAMLPPSRHDSGNFYEWLHGKEPWSVQIMDAPQFLLDEIQRLHGRFGGSSSSGTRSKTAAPAYVRNIAGDIVNGREEYARNLVWGIVVTAYRNNPDRNAVPAEAFDWACSVYFSKVKTRHTIPGENEDLLESEDRGISMLRRKWQYALKQWDGKAARDAANPPPDKARHLQLVQPSQPAPPNVDPETGEVIPQDPAHYESLSATEIDALADPVWLIDDMIIEKSFGFIYGRPGSGKSFLALSIALAISTGLKEWFGRKIHRNGPVIYISSEGTGDIKFRLRAWKNHYGVSLDNSQFRLIRQSINFMSAADIQKLVDTIEHTAQTIGHPSMVIVDTVSRVLPGAEENLQKDMTLFIGACDRIRELFGCTVLGVHHTNKEGAEMRGSTTLMAAGDSVFFVDREEGAPGGMIHAKKVKSARDGWMMPFGLKEMPMGDLKGTSSLVATATDSAPPVASQEASEGWPPKATQWAILDAMQAAWAAKNPWSSKERSRTEGRYAIAIMHARFGVSGKAADSMLNWWLDHGMVAYEMCDKKTKAMGIHPTNQSRMKAAETGGEASGDFSAKAKTDEKNP